MNKLIFLLFICYSSVIFAQSNDSITEEWVRKHYVKKEVKIEMRDGVHLFTSIYEPKDKTVKHPIIMNRTCYGVGPYGEGKFMGLHRPAWREFTRNNYIFVFQDVRGKNASEGDFEDIRPFIEGKSLKKAKKQRKLGEKVDIDEASDTYDTAEWLIHNTNSNGNIGVFGISYPGFYSTMAGLSGHPAIKAVSPQAPVTDWFRGDDAHHNGAFFIWDMFSFQYWFEKLNVLSNRIGEWGTISSSSPANIVHTDAYNDYLKLGAIKNFSALFGDSLKGWNDIVCHPNLDDWWEERNVVYHCKDVKPAVMVVGGLFDAEDCYGAFATYKAIKENSPKTDLYLVEGPWSHGAWSRGAVPFFGNVFYGEEQVSDYYCKNIEYPFFAYYLEGKGEKPSAKVRVFDSGSAVWHNYSTWPVESAKTPYVLTNKQVSYISDPAKPVPSQSGPSTERTTVYMLDDQRFASRRPDVAVFSFPTLTDTLKLSGEVEAELHVSITTTDADFIVKIIDVFPEDFAYDDKIYTKYHKSPYNMAGYQMLVRGEVMRGKYRNSFTNPEPFVPGEKTVVKFKLPDVAHTFLPGHKLMIQVQSSWFPLVDRNPQKFCNIYTCDDSDFQSSTITIYPESKVWLPIIK